MSTCNFYKWWAKKKLVLFQKKKQERGVGGKKALGETVQHLQFTDERIKAKRGSHFSQSAQLTSWSAAEMKEEGILASLSITSVLYYMFNNCIYNFIMCPKF